MKYLLRIGPEMKAFSGRIDHNSLFMNTQFVRVKNHHAILRTIDLNRPAKSQIEGSTMSLRDGEREGGRADRKGIALNNQIADNRYVR
jgi:hypothetical protein